MIVASQYRIIKHLEHNFNNNNNNFISIALLSYVQGALQSCKQHYWKIFTKGQFPVDHKSLTRDETSWCWNRSIINLERILRRVRHLISYYTLNYCNNQNTVVQWSWTLFFFLEKNFIDNMLTIKILFTINSLEKKKKNYSFKTPFTIPVDLKFELKTFHFNKKTVGL